MSGLGRGIDFFFFTFIYFFFFGGGLWWGGGESGSGRGFGSSIESFAFWILGGEEKEGERWVFGFIYPDVFLFFLLLYEFLGCGVLYLLTLFFFQTKMRRNRIRAQHQTAGALAGSDGVCGRVSRTVLIFTNYQRGVKRRSECSCGVCSMALSLCRLSYSFSFVPIGFGYI